MNHGSQVKAMALADTKILKTAIIDSFRKIASAHHDQDPVIVRGRSRGPS